MSGGWLPPSAPGGRPPPRFDAPAPAPAPPRRPSPRTPAPRTDPRVVWALVLGVAALLVLLLTAGTAFALTVPCSAGAIVLARRAATDGRARVALWLGRIGAVAGVAAGVIWVALLLAGFDAEELRRELEQRLEERQGSDR